MSQATLCSIVPDARMENMLVGCVGRRRSKGPHGLHAEERLRDTGPSPGWRGVQASVLPALCPFLEVMTLFVLMPRNNIKLLEGDD